MADLCLLCFSHSMQREFCRVRFAVVNCLTVEEIRCLHTGIFHIFPSIVSCQYLTAAVRISQQQLSYKCRSVIIISTKSVPATPPACSKHHGNSVFLSFQKQITDIIHLVKQCLTVICPARFPLTVPDSASIDINIINTKCRRKQDRLYRLFL